LKHGARTSYRGEAAGTVGPLHASQIASHCQVICARRTPVSKYQGGPWHFNFRVWSPIFVKREPTIDSTDRLLV
jgi:hypothetical protein